MPLKRQTSDEFYTIYDNIEKIYKSRYINPTVFKDKIIYCNCDDYRWSNYVKFWQNNFDYFGINKLIATNYDIGDGAYIYTYDGINENVSVGIDNGSYEHYNDFITDNTIITTNPPFSKCKRFLPWLKEHNANFYVHSSIINTVKYWENLNNIYFLYSHNICDYELDGIKKFVAASGIMTNIRFDKTASKVKLNKTFNDVHHDFYYEDDFHKCNVWKGKILNIDWCNKIPYDYNDYMGVPISFLWVQPEIRSKYHIYGIAIYGKKFFRLRIRKNDDL